MSKTKMNKIRASLSTVRLKDEPLLSRLQAVFDAMDGNPDYPTPPVELPVYKAKIDSFASKIALALDGSKTAKAERDRERHEAVKMYEQLGHYVEGNCKDDLATFRKSGFTPVSASKRHREPWNQPSWE